MERLIQRSTLDMLVFDNKEVVFIHIQKTGGTWIREVLTQLGIPWTNIINTHKVRYEPTLAKARNIYPNHFIFSTIRNPLTWYQSYWAMKMLRATETNNRWDGTGIIELNQCKSNNFNEFIACVTSTCPGHLTRKYEECLDNTVHLLRQENLTVEFTHLLHQLEIDFDTKIIHNRGPIEMNASLPEYRPQVLYTEENAKRVVETEASIFTKYGYSTEIRSCCEHTSI
jgi:hypothetical protein